MEIKSRVIGGNNHKRKIFVENMRLERGVPENFYIYTSKRLIKRCKLWENYLFYKKTGLLKSSISFSRYKTSVYLLLNYFIETLDDENFKQIDYHILADVATENLYKIAVRTLKRVGILCILSKDGKECYYKDKENKIGVSFCKKYKLNTVYYGDEIEKLRVTDPKIIQKFHRMGRFLFLPLYIIKGGVYDITKHKITWHKNDKVDMYRYEHTKHFDVKLELAEKYLDKMSRGEIITKTYYTIRKKMPKIAKDSKQMRGFILKRARDLGYNLAYMAAIMDWSNDILDRLLNKCKMGHNIMNKFKIKPKPA